jgi:pimeloyl-ACP methyl ester carboxylesterase
MTTEHFISPQGRRLAHRRFAPARSGLTYVWLCGFKSDISGTKVLRLESWCRENGHGFLAFDYSGHGGSDGAFEDGTISAWRQDALDAIDALTDGPLVLVGSSMGGWMALLAALARRERIAGMVLIAPAPDFTEKLMWPEFTPRQQEDILKDGLTLRPSDYGEPYPITRALIEDGRTWQILDAPIDLECPVRILQGAEDPDVPWRHAFRLVEAMSTRDLAFTLIKDGDHRLSREQDIARLLATCAELAAMTNP